MVLFAIVSANAWKILKAEFSHYLESGRPVGHTEVSKEEPSTQGLILILPSKKEDSS